MFALIIRSFAAFVKGAQAGKYPPARVILLDFAGLSVLFPVANGAIGHLQSVRKMVEDGRDCSEVLIQIAAVRSAINNIGKVILQDHIQHCIVDAVEQNDAQALDDLCQAIDKFIK